MQLPELKSVDGGRPYRVWTVGLMPLNQLPRFEPGMTAPAFVPVTDWRVIPDWDGRLYVHRGDGIRHELHGTQHASEHDARRAAYGAGLLGVMVYEADAADYGFPSA
ncbi:hypothetical protein [Dactylosporangium sp. CA-139066]|uniref:hypothetical protein n=1 Tax=Dactylosporangium sp. CA-139066 TaxID=3239930 RepID=UPI003D949730